MSRIIGIIASFFPSALAAFLLSCAPGAQAAVFVVGDTGSIAAPLAVLDGTFTTLPGAPAVASGGGVIGKVTVSITFVKCGDGGLTAGGACAGTGSSFDDQIVFRLEGPSGVYAFLIDAATYSGPEAPGVGVVTIDFVDGAAAQGGSSVAGGTFAPVEPLAIFNGLSGLDFDGVWSLFAQDTGPRLEPLFVIAWSATIETVEAIPEPASLALLGVGLVGLGWARARGGVEPRRVRGRFAATQSVGT